jgi:mRNA interferase RelE/StbE
MSWEVRIAERVLKTMKRIPPKDSERLLAVLYSIRESPYHGDIQKLKGEEATWRRRIGNYRIIYQIVHKNKIINILDIRRWTDTTYQ